MQKLFDRNKRKHDGGSKSDERTTKQQKHSERNGDDSRISKSMERARIDPRPSMSSSTSPAQTRKIANLIKALDEALEEDGMDQTVDFIGEQALNRCLELRTSLKPARSKLDESARDSSSILREQKSHDFFNIPKTFSAFAVTPWKSSTIPETLPPLPKILDATLETSAFTHLSCGSGKPSDLSYERLEWIGDAYMELIATLLISQTFPFLLPGKCSQHREMLVKNLTLADFSRKYGFDKRLRLNPEILPMKPHDMTKILGDVFESYVAAVILSDPEEGVFRAAQWLKDLWGMTLAKEIIHEERTGLKLVSPMWKLQGSEVVLNALEKEQAPVHPKVKLMQLIGSKAVKISYREAAPVGKDPNTKLPVFTEGVYLDGYGETNKLLGTGQGNGKKDAGMRAAEVALANTKIIQLYSEKKKQAVESQQHLERETLDA